MPETVVVFAGGPAPDPRVAALVPRDARLVGADSGAEHALALGLRVELVVGDLDSIDAAALAELEGAGARVERHPVDKDASDLELALGAALSLGPRRVLVVGGAGGRLDQLLGELLLLGGAAYAAVELDALLGAATVHVVRSERSFDGAVGELVTLLALHGPAYGVETEGLAYPLRGETLEPGSSRGLSNRFAAARATVRLEGGVVLAVRPGSAAA